MTELVATNFECSSISHLFNIFSTPKSTTRDVQTMVLGIWISFFIYLFLNFLFCKCCRWSNLTKTKEEISLFYIIISRKRTLDWVAWVIKSFLPKKHSPIHLGICKMIFIWKGFVHQPSWQWYIVLLVPQLN